jgi:hypothetical protein
MSIMATRQVMASIAHVEKVDFLEQLLLVVFELADHWLQAVSTWSTQKAGACERRFGLVKGLVPDFFLLVVVVNELESHRLSFVRCSEQCIDRSKCSQIFHHHSHR